MATGLNSMKTTKVLALTCLALALSASASAQNLPQDFEKALAFDPTYQSAKADYQVGQRNIKVARSVFFPEATFNTQRLATDTSGRTTFTVLQPLIDVQRWMTLGQAAPQQLLAEVNLLSKRQELATRLLKAANAIILANESAICLDAIVLVGL